jgi:ribonuclease VapC
MNLLEEVSGTLPEDKEAMLAARIQIVPLTAEQLEIARIAWRKYGKGRHPAGLNIGDCCSYALAECAGEPLLFKGNDFSQTDIKTVHWTS